MVLYLVLATVRLDDLLTGWKPVRTLVPSINTLLDGQHLPLKVLLSSSLLGCLFAAVAIDIDT